MVKSSPAMVVYRHKYLNEPLVSDEASVQVLSIRSRHLRVEAVAQTQRRHGGHEAVVGLCHRLDLYDVTIHIISINVDYQFMMDDDGSELLHDRDCVVQRPCDGLGHKTAL